jgi:NADPH:quinone reductase-like Zn-dependent oxidoreductase
MKAVRIHRFGGPEVLQLDAVDRPAPPSGALLIRVCAASVNPVDYKIRRGGYPRVKEADLPVTLGRDVAGVVVVAAGDFRVGDEVYAHLAWTEGGYAEYAVVAPPGAALKPKSLDMTAAAGVPLAATTAWQGLFDHGGLKAGQRVLIHGASGAVGAYAVQFARQAGAHVIATASGEGAAIANDLGADQVIDYKRERFEDVVTDLDLVFDLVGGETQGRSFPLIKRGGALISAVQEPDAARAEALGVRIVRYLATPSADLLRRFAAMIDAGALKVTVAKTSP